MSENMDIRRNYNGYLRPYLPTIIRMAENGTRPMEIARNLYEVGARTLWTPNDRAEMQIASMAGLVGHILGTRRTINGELKKAERRVKWATEELAKAKRRLRELKAAALSEKVATPSD